MYGDESLEVCMQLEVATYVECMNVVGYHKIWLGNSHAMGKVHWLQVPKNQNVVM